MATRIDPTKHIIRETPIGNFFRRHLNEPGIITFFNVETGQWILAYWLHRDKGLVDEIEDLGAQFEVVDEAFVKMITRCWGPIDWQKKKKLMLSRHRTRELRKRDEISDFQEKYDWMKKRSQHPLPFSFN